MTFLIEFKDFLMEYKVAGLAIAFIMGAAATTLVKALVDYIIMPIVAVLTPGIKYEEIVITLTEQSSIQLGLFIGAVVNFVIIAGVVFLIVKIVLREEKVTKK
ncbi:MAG: large conductance mechanosensitive channel protein MscL [Candidatus Micrarchaeota archaeon]